MTKRRYSNNSPTCSLCGRDLSPQSTGREGFCSAGCRSVHRTLGRRDENSETPAANQPAPNPATGAQHTNETESQSDRTYLRIDGMQSVTCEELLESVAEGLDGVVDAEASYVTETVRIDHHESVSDDTLRSACSTAGYTAYFRSDTADADSESTGPTRRSREMTGIRKRRSENVLGLRYAVGVVFGAFLLIPYLTLAYPTYLAELLDWSVLDLYRGAFQLEGTAGAFFFRLYFALTGLVLVFTGLPVLRGAYASFRTRRVNTDLLVAITVISAFCYSAGAIFVGRNDVYYDLMLVVAAVVAGVALYETAVKQEAMDALTDLTRSEVDEARLYDTDGGTREVPVEAVETGNSVLVRAGERVPVDGTLEGQACTVEEAIITGESLPIRKESGDDVLAGSVVTDGAAVITAGDRQASSLDRITTAVWNIQSSTHGIQRQADRLASLCLPLLAGLAAVAAGFAFSAGASIPAAVLVVFQVFLVITPWAVGLATPLTIATSIRTALDHGIAVFDDTVFERLRDVDVVVFDKTGTLTTGEMEVLEATIPEELCTAVARLEQHANHPAARAIATAYGPSMAAETACPDGGGTDDLDTRYAAVTDIEQLDTGIEGMVGGGRILAGTLELFKRRDWTVSDTIERRAAEARDIGQLPVVVGRDGRAGGLIIVGDEPRSEWDDVLSRLGTDDRTIVVLTGDDSEAVDRFDGHFAVDHAFASIPPAGKTATIDRLGQQGTVAMIGDGTNDAAALAAADLGISLGSGTALAADAADLAIIDDDLRSVDTAFALSAATRRRVRQNTALAVCYNAVTIPLAIGGWFNPVTAMAAVVLTGGLLGYNSVRPMAGVG